MTIGKEPGRGKWKLPAVAALLAACLAFAIALVLTPSQTPTALATAPTVSTVKVAPLPFKDSRTVKVQIGVSGARKLITGSEGTLTASSCAAGESLTSGRSTFSIDGEPLINLATSSPLWRDLAPGTTGEDVAGLQTELTRLGHPAPVTSTVDRPTLEAYAALAATLKAPFQGAGITKDRIMWLPAPSQTIQKCTVTPGALVSAGAELAELPPQPVSAKVSPLPPDLAPGPRILIIDAHKFPVSSDGNLVGGSLNDLAGTTGFAASQAQGDEGTLAGQFELATPTRVLGVPAGSLFAVQTSKACISSQNISYPVSILGSQLGVSFVAGDHTDEIKEVDLKPDPGASCG